jgi:5-oxopent-3-ene-1,2,5-tricarboxylate decarboxylase/2-hydroxyhepta-2,4-diene-1,7-dioate isomerase
MKRVRVVAEGRVVEGEWRPEEGLVLDPAGRAHAEADVVFLPPVEPRNIIGFALNYADHAKELGLERPPEPALFLKPTATAVGHRAPVLRPAGVRELHYEVELAVVIGRPCRRVSPARALDYVLGYTVANDVTARDFIRNTFRPPVRAKGWDSFCPLGPCLVPATELDPSALELEAYVNGERRQRGNTRDMIYGVPEIVAYLSDFMTLAPGDVILTGTPEGLSFVHPGDVMRLAVEGIGVLENPVREGPGVGVEA